MTIYLYTCATCRISLAKSAVVIRASRTYCETHAPEKIADAPCKRCEWDTAVPHNSCIYGGNRVGHSKAHCTADACY